MEGKKIISILIFFTLFFSKAHAQKVLELTENELKNDLTNTFFSVFEDKSANLSFQEIQKKTFEKYPTTALNFGYSESKFWIKFQLKNATDKKWLVAIMASLVDEFEFYQVFSDGKFEKRVSGDKYPHSQREEDLPVFGFKTQIPKGETNTFYLSVRSIDTKQFTILIEDEAYFLKNQHNKIYLWFFYFGLLFMMVVYNLLLYFSIFDKSYIFYVFYILSFIFAQLTLLGFGNQHIWGNYVWFANRTPVFFTSTTGIFAILFAYQFLNVSHFYPKFKLFFNLLILANLTLGILTIIEPNVIYNRFSSYLIIIQVTFVVVVGILILRKGYPPARYYMLSWAVLFVALILFSLKMSGLLPLNQITYTLLPIGAAIEVLMLSLGLGYRINSAQKEKTEAQKELVNQLLENEHVRSRIARDLHDDLGSTLSSIRILSEFAQNQTKFQPETVPILLDKITNSTQKLQENLQDIVWTTQSKDNTLNELTTRMRRFGGEILEAKNMDFSLKIDDKIYQQKFSSDAQYDIFMIFKEAINNIVKYSNAEKVWINWGFEGKKLVLEIRDNGLGFDINSEKEGNGLKNMIKRAENIGGELEIFSEINYGTKIWLRLSVPQ